MRTTARSGARESTDARGQRSHAPSSRYRRSCQALDHAETHAKPRTRGGKGTAGPQTGALVDPEHLDPVADRAVQHAPPSGGMPDQVSRQLRRDELRVSAPHARSSRGYAGHRPAQCPDVLLDPDRVPLVRGLRHRVHLTITTVVPEPGAELMRSSSMRRLQPGRPRPRPPPVLKLSVSAASTFPIPGPSSENVALTPGRPPPRSCST